MGQFELNGLAERWIAGEQRARQRPVHRRVGARRSLFAAAVTVEPLAHPGTAPSVVRAANVRDP